MKKVILNWTRRPTFAVGERGVLFSRMWISLPVLYRWFRIWTPFAKPWEVGAQTLVSSAAWFGDIIPGVASPPEPPTDRSEIKID